ncbi:hypothetical protein M378DRAFT_172641 [Amanita muscaria Koide BX008]|uniref:Uncharacterized protein n=1 Tax=Amanita muscaria (strain Koide BX008) TaxID=946122 RepID=A0A0C2WIQ7_AMAMK|nr:hypothetical protein M378DRAFT_172641 [Amanita muscaria Koide BX008]
MKRLFENLIATRTSSEPYSEGGLGEISPTRTPAYLLVMTLCHRRSKPMAIWPILQIRYDYCCCEGHQPCLNRQRNEESTAVISRCHELITRLSTFIQV